MPTDEQQGPRLTAEQLGRIRRMVEDEHLLPSHLGALLLAEIDALRGGIIAELEQINAAAEEDMLRGGPITEAHFRAIERRLAELREALER